MKSFVAFTAIALMTSSGYAKANWTHVTSQSGDSGTIDVFVENSGLPSERWRFEVQAFSDGSTYSVLAPVDGQSFTIQGTDVSGFYQDFGGNPFAMVTLHTPEFPGVQFATNGYFYFPPGVRPPTHVEGDMPYILRRDGEIGEIWSSLPAGMRIGCAGAAISAIGDFILTGAAWRMAVSGFARGTMSLNLATATVYGAGLATLGASVVAFDACRQS
jgi:hypothetical protein